MIINLRCVMAPGDYQSTTDRPAACGLSASANGAVIVENVFVNCAAPDILLDWGFGTRQRTLLPANVTVENNIFVSPADPATRPTVAARRGTNFIEKDNVPQQAAQFDLARKLKPLPAADVDPAWLKRANAGLSSASGHP